MEEDLLHARGGCHIVLYGYSRAVVPNDDMVSLHAIHLCWFSLSQFEQAKKMFMVDIMVASSVD